jgi:anti-sigma factor RsiW
MSCEIDLKAYAVGEAERNERTAVEDHLRGCQGCREELERLNITRAALATLEDEEIPRRIAFVSDRVFEPRWWQTIWHSAPVMGFASAAVLACAILVHGFARPAVAGVSTAQIEQQVEARVSARVQAAVSQAETKQAAEFARVMDAAAKQRKDDLANFEQAAEYYQRQMARFEVASNQVASNQGYGR